MNPQRIRNRFVPDRRNLKPEEMLYVDICVAAQCRWRGIQKAMPEHNLEALGYFDDDFGSSLCLPLSKFNLENVREHLAASNIRWARAKARRAEENNGNEAGIGNA